jgi:hypothetical protein
MFNGNDMELKASASLPTIVPHQPPQRLLCRRLNICTIIRLEKGLADAVVLCKL